jgi:uncharacterized protein (AIM24 family)
MGEDEVEGLDEEFLYHLSRGSDFLAAGDAEAARASLDRALQLRPKDAKVLGLLGQALYKMGRFEQAVEIYGRLVDDNPVESAARVNLGLACLKAKKLGEAVKQLNIALDLNPDHARAMGYLGLALFESGEIAQARDWFAKAGKEQMVARCDEMLASGPRPEAPSPGAEIGSADPLHTPMPGDLPAYRPPVPAVSPQQSQDLAAFAAARLVEAPGPTAANPFALGGRTLSLAVPGEILARTEGLFASLGTFRLAPEMKRFRGKAIDQPFGDGAGGMQRISGQGTLFYAAEGRRFTALDLGAEAAYFREEAVFAFEERVVFENGRVPSDAGVDLDLVHLRGPGRFLLVTRSEPLAIEVTPSSSLRVPLTALVGWIGALTPRVLGLAGTLAAGGEVRPPDAALWAVELNGEGRVLLDVAPLTRAQEPDARG